MPGSDFFGYGTCEEPPLIFVPTAGYWSSDEAGWDGDVGILGLEGGTGTLETQRGSGRRVGARLKSLFFCGFLYQADRGSDT